MIAPNPNASTRRPTEENAVESLGSIIPRLLDRYESHEQSSLDGRSAVTPVPHVPGGGLSTRREAECSVTA